MTQDRMGSGTRLGNGLIWFVAALLIFGLICYLATRFDTFPGDEESMRRFQDVRNSFLDTAARAASFLAQFVVAIVSIVVASLIMLVVNRKADAIAFFLVLPAEGIHILIKLLVDRPRPEFPIVISTPSLPSFPSGHALHALLFFGLLLIMVWDLIGARWLKIATAVLLGMGILACGASRVYLGVHWSSDIIGGYIFAGIAIAAILWARKKLVTRIRE